MDPELSAAPNQDAATAWSSGAAPALNLAAPRLPQANNDIIDLLNVGDEGVKVRVKYHGQRGGDTITARFGALRQIKVLDESNLDVPAYDVKFPVVDVAVGTYEVGYEVKSIEGNITPSNTLSVDVINSGAPHGQPEGGELYWMATSGAPNLDTPASDMMCNLVTLQGDPDRVLVISDISEGVKVGPGIVPRPASAPATEVQLDSRGRATLWVTRSAPKGRRASFTLTDKASPFNAAIVWVTFGPWISAHPAPLEFAYTTHATAGSTPCSIYIKNISPRRRQVSFYSSQGWAGIEAARITVEPGRIEAVQLSCAMTIIATVEIESEGVPMPPVTLIFFPMEVPKENVPHPG